MLKIDNIEFSYPEQTSPFCFNLELKAGEIILISGISGAGKSTLLDLIAGFLDIEKGSIILDGFDISSLKPQQRPVSILLQSDNLFEHLSVRKNLALALPAKTSAILLNEKVKQSLAEVGLQDFIDKKVAFLSGGQKQRVALARTLLLNRKILLLDEPFSALDEKAANAMRELLKKLVKEYSWHTIIVSHNLTDIKNLNASHYILANNQLTKTAS